jgi:general stress protein 26
MGSVSGRRVTTGSDGQTAAAARAIIDEIAFMTLATVDADGIPWASPVWFAHANHANFFWISRPETRHSQNIASNPRIAIVIFDSRTPIDTGRGVYLEAEANEVADDAEVERIMAIFSERSVAQGGSAWTAAEVRAPADLRPYRATVLKAFLGVNDRRTEVRLSH